MAKGKLGAVLIMGAGFLLLGGLAIFFVKGGGGGSKEGSAGLSSAPALPSAQAFVPLTGHIFYDKKKYGFGLYVPPDISVREYDEGGGSVTIVFEDSSGEKGFQIFITPYGEDKITPERFALDHPMGVASDLSDVTLGGNPAVSFSGQNQLLGQTKEIWSIKNGFLYELTTYSRLSDWFSAILASWRWSS